MKSNAIYMLVVVMVMMLFSMCRKDMGNYDYREIPELRIDTTGAAGPFTVRVGIEELVVTPRVIYTGTEDLDYYWIAEPNSTTFNFRDTLSREKELRTTIHLPISSSVGHTLFYMVVERETGRSAIVKYTLRVTGSTGTGMMVAHEKNGTVDIDLIGTPTTDNNPITRNIYQAVNGSRLPGKVTGLATVGENNLFMLMTDQSMSLMVADGMVRQFADEEIFGLLTPDVFKPESFFYRSGTINYLINNGHVYQNFINNSAPGLMTQRMLVDDGSNYRMSPVYLEGTTTGFFFDELGKRMLQTGAASSNTLTRFAKANATEKFSLDYIDRKILFGKKGFNLGSFLQSTAYVFFADQTGSGRYLYVMVPNTPATPAKALIDISASPDIQDAKYYEVFETAPCVYYATEQKLYLLQVNSGGNSYVNAGVEFTPPAGEVISCIKLDRTGGTAELFYYIATWNESTGQSTVRQFSINTGTGRLSTSPVRTWTGFDGKITMMNWKRY